MGTLGKAAWKLIKMLLKSKIRGKAVRLMDVYSLALSEMSNTLGTPPPPDATIVSETEKIRSFHESLFRAWHSSNICQLQQSQRKC